jgi:DNA-binding transcriptional LysR family regulator
MEAALAEARDSARRLDGTLRLAFPVTVAGPAVSLLPERFTDRYPGATCPCTTSCSPIPTARCATAMWTSW